MLSHFESELQRIVAVTKENEKISSEYSHKLFRIFLTATEAREILKIIKNHKDYEVVQSRIAC